MKNFLLPLLLLQLASPLFAQPLRIAVAGTTHGHSGWILGKKDSQHVVVVGIYEPNKQLVRKQIKQFNLNPALFYEDLPGMLDRVKPEAVAAFGSIYDHLAVVEACAPRGIHVMVEKPLAVSVQHARRMEELARKHNIHLLTNYETSWYPTTSKTLQLSRDSNYVGRITKAVFHHGHEGPKEIGVGDEFFEWLTDPKLNGGGAVIDFGCYGANIMTALMDSTRPLSVSAVLGRYKPNIYPKVDDEATIIVEYPRAQAIIQASWNWPYGRKDMELYGDSGFVISYDAHKMKRRSGNSPAADDSASVSGTKTYTDPFQYFADVVRKKITVEPYGVYSLENNVRVVEILEAAIKSSQSGRKVVFSKHKN